MLSTTTTNMLHRVLRLYSSKTAAQATHDVVVIGGGPGGYFAAIKAAQLGYNTACIEKRGTLGGTCLNVGCIPSKSLLNNSLMYHQIIADTKQRGIDIDPQNVKLNFPKLMDAKDKTVKQLTGGIELLFRKNKVTYYKGTGSFASPNEVLVEPIDSSAEPTLLKSDKIVIATGSEVTPFPGITIDEHKIVSSTGILALKEVPKNLTIIGAGIIGLEMASVYNRLGSKVTILEYQNSIGGNMDTEIAQQTLKILKKQGITFKLGTKVLGAETGGNGVSTSFETIKNGKKDSIDSDILLVAIGRRPYTKGLNLEKIGIETDKRGRILIDNQLSTKYPHIKCIGDVTLGPMLAHKAEDEGIAAVEFWKNDYGHVNYANIPAVMYTHPEIAWVGKNEQDLKKDGVQYKVGKFPFLANSRAKCNMDTEGLVKILIDAKTERLLGAHIIGPNAGEMIAEAGLALEYGASAEDIARVCHAHPTLSEAFKEATMDAYDKPINF